MEKMDETPGPDPAADELDSLWEDIGNGVREIHQSKKLDRMRYIDLYSKVYNYCLTRGRLIASRHTLGSGPRSKSTRVKHGTPTDVNEPVGPGLSSTHVVEKKLYEQLANLLTELLQEKVWNFATKSGIDLLKSYNDEWDAFKSNSQQVNRVFSYLNRQWIHHGPGDIVHENRETSKPFQIYHLALSLWKSVVFGTIKQNLLKEILTEFEKDRMQISNTDKLLLKQVIASYITLGMDLGPPRDTSGTFIRESLLILDSFTKLVLQPNFYVEHLEQHVIVATEEYFNKLASNFITCNPGKIQEYLKLVQSEIAHEEERARWYFPPLSYSKILKVVDDALIRDHLVEIQSNFVAFLENEQLEDLERAYTLVYRLGNELPPFCKMLTDHVTVRGKQAMEKCFQEQKTKGVTDPKPYVEALLSVYLKYKNMIVEQFKSNMAMKSALDVACETFINHNAVTQSGGNVTSQKSAELLAKYADGILRKAGRNVDEKTLDEIIQLFQFLADKDAFQMYYSARLAYRLIYQNAGNDDAEQMMIEKLKQHSGFDYTQKLTTMYKDIVISRDLSNNFRQFTTEKQIALPFDFQPYILASGSWPFKLPQNDFTLPQQLEQPINSFVEFYTTRHEGRKLIWLQDRSRAELRCNCFATPHIFQLSMYQMAILLLYNTETQYRFNEILEATSMPPDLCLAVLETLTTAHLLTSGGEDGVKPQEVSNETLFKLNLDYKNARIRVVLPTLKLEHKSDADRNERRITDNRKYIIQACIVRVMKARKVIGHKELELAVVEQIHKQFPPDSATITKCVELLIQKEYMKRAEEDSNKYLYI